MSVEKRGMKKADLLRLESYTVTIDPPADLAPAVAEVFKETVASCSPKHFRKSDIPVLTSYATATVLATHYAKSMVDAAAIKTWNEIVKLQLALARSLRLTVQSRADAKTIARHQQPNTTPPWEWERDTESA